MKDGLENKIKCLIEELYNCILEAPIKVESEDKWYSVTICTLNDFQGGVTLAGQFDSEEAFLDYLCKELKQNRLDYSSHGLLRIIQYVDV